MTLETLKMTTTLLYFEKYPTNEVYFQLFCTLLKLELHSLGPLQWPSS